MPNNFDLQIKPLSGSQLEVQAENASALTGTERVLAIQGSTVVETTTQSIADLGGSGTSYLVYTALLSQSGTDAPVATVLENTLGGTVVWSYDSPGFYIATLAGAFPTGKVAILFGNTFGGVVSYAGEINSAPDSIYFSSFNAAVSENGLMSNSPIRIEVYP